MPVATKPAADLGALHVVPLRNRPPSPLVTVLSVSVSAIEAGTSNEESEGEALIAILADALESIAECTPDDGARKIAGEALAFFHGR